MPVGGHEDSRSGRSSVVIPVKAQAQEGGVLRVDCGIYTEIEQVEIERADINHIELVKDWMIVLHIEDPILVVVLVVSKPE